MKGKVSSFAKYGRRSGVIMIDNVECDCCDKIKKCISLDIGIIDFVWVICEDCLQEFLYPFYDNKKIRKTKLIKFK